MISHCDGGYGNKWPKLKKNPRLPLRTIVAVAPEAVG
jgi:hypothetical protein